MLICLTVNIMETSFVNPLCFEGEKVYFRTRSRMQRPRAWQKSCTFICKSITNQIQCIKYMANITAFHQQSMETIGNRMEEARKTTLNH